MEGGREGSSAARTSTPSGYPIKGQGTRPSIRTHFIIDRVGGDALSRRTEAGELTRWVPNTRKAIKGTAEAEASEGAGVITSGQRSTEARAKGREGGKMLTEADDDVPGVVGHAREEDERAADADDAHEAEHRDAQEERERDLERVVRLVQREPVPVEHPADVD